MTTSLAQEINQPLTAILSNAQAAKRFLSQAPPDIGEVRQILDDIIRDDRRASEVVRKVWALVKKEQPRQEPLDLNEMIQQVVDLIRGDSLLQGLSIGTDLNPELATVHGDGTKLQQVILNRQTRGFGHGAFHQSDDHQSPWRTFSNNREGGAAFAFTLPAHLGDRS